MARRKLSLSLSVYDVTSQKVGKKVLAVWRRMKHLEQNNFFN